MKETLKFIGICLAGGLLAGIAIRITEHVIPPPEIRVLYCTQNDARTGTQCKSLAEMIKKTIAKSETEKE